MITLITATPGAGKTAYAVWHEIRTAEAAGRVVYTCGIPRLKIPSIVWTYEQARLWAVKKPDVIDSVTGEVMPPLLENVHEGSLIVIDEVQQLWRNGSTTAKDVTPDISYLEKHRHHGLDFVIITQHPDLVHANVRRLVGKHIHIRKTPLGMYLYEFSEWCAHPETRGGRDNSARRRYSLNKNVFPLYESASLHVKTSHRKPLQVYVLMFLLLLVPIAIYFLWSRIHAKIHPLPAPQSVHSVFGGSVVSAPGVTGETVKPAQLDVSAVSNQVNWSSISSCISSKKKCLCYGLSSERLVVPDAICRRAVVVGWSRPVVLPAGASPLSSLPVAAPAATTTQEEVAGGAAKTQPMKWETNVQNI
jgi:zona occludens toxin